MGEIRLELLAEEDVTDAQRALAGALISESFDAPQARNRGWILCRPIYRVFAWDGDLLVGCEKVCLVGCKPPVVVHGLGDAAVREGWRLRGIARAMGALLHQEGVRRGAHAVMSYTPVLGGVALERGMEPVRPGEVYLSRRLRRDLPLVENWYVRWHGEKVVPLTIDGRF